MTKQIEVMIDSIGSTAGHIPAKTKKVAGYRTGGPGIAWTEKDWDRFHGAKVPINQSTSTDPRLAPVVDIEPGAATIASAVAVARGRKALLKETTTFYCEGSLLSDVRAAVKAAGLEEWVLYWVANWSLSRQEAIELLGGRIVAIQYASPTSNPDTILPGTRHTTLREANCDLSVTLTTWFPVPAKKAKPKREPVHRKVKASTASSAIAAAAFGVLAAMHVHVDEAISGAVATLAGTIAGYLTPGKKT